MLALAVLSFFASTVESQDTESQDTESQVLVYDQSIYEHLFQSKRETFGKYDKNSPPLRKDDMTRYTDGMEEFDNDIDKFVEWHCEPYVNFLKSKWLIRFTVLYFKQIWNGIISQDLYASIYSRVPKTDAFSCPKSELGITVRDYDNGLRLETRVRD